MKNQANVKLKQPPVLFLSEWLYYHLSQYWNPHFIKKKNSTTHITFIVNIYNMWWKGLELNFIVPTKIHNLPNWLIGPTSKSIAPQI